MPAHDVDQSDLMSDARFVIDDVPLALLDSPIDYIFADNMRQRQFCNILKMSSNFGRISVRHARLMADFMTCELAWHFSDEEDDLFPRLSRRARPEDGLALLLERIGADRRHMALWQRMILEELTQPRHADISIGSDVQKVMVSYADTYRRHLAIENGIVLSIARIRLKKDDQMAISRAMKMRRGVPA